LTRHDGECQTLDEKDCKIVHDTVWENKCEMVITSLSLKKKCCKKPGTRRMEKKWGSWIIAASFVILFHLKLNLKTRQNIKNLVGNFGALNVGNMHAKFQAPSFNGVGGGGGDRRKGWQWTSRHNANFPPSFTWGDNLILGKVLNCLCLHSVLL